MHPSSPSHNEPLKEPTRSIPNTMARILVAYDNNICRTLVVIRDHRMPHLTGLEAGDWIL